MRPCVVLLAGVLIWAPASGCGTLLKYTPLQYDNPETGEHVYKMEDNKLGRISGEPELAITDPHASDAVYLNAMKTVNPNGVEQYKIEVIVNRYAEHGWDAVKESDYLLIRNGTSMIFYADQDVIVTSTHNASRPDLEPSGVNPNANLNQGGMVCKDTAIYDIEKEQLVKLSKAKSVKVKIQGKDSRIEKEFTKWNLKHFKLFVEAVCN